MNCPRCSVEGAIHACWTYLATIRIDDLAFEIRIAFVDSNKRISQLRGSLRYQFRKLLADRAALIALNLIYRRRDRNPDQMQHRFTYALSAPHFQWHMFDCTGHRWHYQH